MRTRLLAACLVLAGCKVGPDYLGTTTPVPAVYKELAGWQIAQPQDEGDRGAWWSIYNDPVLDGLEREVDISNQTVKEYEALYRSAVALVGESRSGLFPTLGVSGSITRNGGSAGRTGYANTSSTLDSSASWTIDVWGRIRRLVESDVANAQASAGDLASARLSAQGTLAVYYFDLRYEDSLKQLLDQTVAEYTRSLTITQNQYAVGVAARLDVAAAEALVESTQAQSVAVANLRSQYEHAIAVLTGHPPAELTIAAGSLPNAVPVVPPGVPSTLLQRRPDIAAAERAVQRENALIGYTIGAYYPTISLSALYGFTGNPANSVLSAANSIWSLGASGAETVFDAGLRRATVRAARANYDNAVATYRQTTLTAFQQVEDYLVMLRVLAQEAEVQARAVQSIQQATAIAVNEYRAGTVAYTTVVTEQIQELSDEQTALSIQQARVVASANLIQALGGGWQTSDLPKAGKIETSNPLFP